VKEAELVLLFADVDAEKLVTRLLTRGIERGCLRQLTWVAIREPMRDARLAQQPLAALGPHIRSTDSRFLILWDHHGSGREDTDPAEIESEVLATFERADIARERVAAVSFRPELEVVLEPVWTRVLEELARQRAEMPQAIPFDPTDPKSSLATAARAHRLRVDSTVFEDLGAKLSLEGLKKGSTLARIGAVLVRWFGRDG
jgi:hypothetical protein